MLKRAFLLIVLLVPVPAAWAAEDATLPTVELYLPNPCLACIDWAEHLMEQGFRVTLRETADMAAVKRRLRVPKAVESVHTAVVGGYFVEGHVPAEDIKLLLAERPRARGIAVPGLPMGAPGREAKPSSANCETGCTIRDDNAEREPRREFFSTLLVMPDGKTKTFARH